MVQGSVNYRNLMQAVMEKSETTDWESAVDEWELDDVEEDETLEESCVCGKESLRYLFTIRNIINGNYLYPIGSSCINRFDRADLAEEAAVKEQLFKLLHSIEERKFITLSSEFFSRKLLRYLYDISAFKATEYNQYEPYNDYQFLLDMFNARNRTSRQGSKATAIILNSIKPFLQSMLYNKIRNRLKINS
jgi:hypothetical protein